MFGNTGTSPSIEEDLGPLSDAQRDKNPSSQFYLWFGANLTIADFALGFLPVEFGLSIWYSMLALFTGTLGGGILLASMSSMGPKTGMPQMMIGRHAFGESGGMVMSLLQWVNTTGWLTVNTIIAASALSLLIYTTAGSLYVIPVVIIAAAVLSLVYFGHNVIHRFEKIMSLVLGALFLYLTVYTLVDFSGDFSSGTFNLVSFGSIVTLSFSYIMSWGPYASDYSRYVKPGSGGTFWYTMAGSVGSTFWVETVGALVAFAVPSFTTGPSSVMDPLLGRYAVIGLVTLILGGLAANSLNLFSNSVSLKTAGIPLSRDRSISLTLSRRSILVLATIFSIVLGIIGYTVFYSYYEDFLYVLAYWITPWLGIMIADFLLSRRDMTRISPGYNRRTFIAYIIPLIVSLPFINPFQGLEGPFAVWLGGVDISYFVSFALSMLFFYLLRRQDFSPANQAQKK